MALELMRKRTRLPLETLENAIAGNVSLNNTGNFFDGPSVSLTPGTWLLTGGVGLIDTAGGADFIAKLWDGTTVESSGQVTTSAANHTDGIALSGIVTVTTTTAWKISAQDATSTSGLIRAAWGQGNNASYLRAVRIG